MLESMPERRGFSLVIHTTVFFVLVALMLGCTGHSVQTTSGKDYLAKYNIKRNAGEVAAKHRSEPARTAHATFDQALHHVADIEPTISFPARIGVAKIGCQLESNCDWLLPLRPAEVEAWSEMASNLGASFGSIVPMNPLFLEEALTEARRIGLDISGLTAIDGVRLGAARQHLDGIIIYETQHKTSEETNALALGDLTLIGAFVLPSKRIEGQAYAAAIMVDPVTGYPYGQVEASAESDSHFTSRVGANSGKQSAKEDAEARVVQALAAETEKAIRGLRLAIAEKKAGSPD